MKVGLRFWEKSEERQVNKMDFGSVQRPAPGWANENPADNDKPSIEILSARPDWVELLAPCEVETADRIQSLLVWFLADLDERIRDSAAQAFHELLMNAVEWGGSLDPGQKVRIAFLRGQRMVLFRIADPGRGFRFRELTHSALKNPDSNPAQHLRERERKGLRPGGYGLMLVRAAVDELIYNESQNEVVFVKYIG